MAEGGEEPPQQQYQGEAEQLNPAEQEKDQTAMTPLNIWPPTQRTREAVIHRLVETLSSPSVLSKRYGTLPHDEASSAARLIEEEAFSAAAVNRGGGPEDDGIEILQIYSKEISTRMLETVKARASSTTPSPIVSNTSEEISSLDSESSHA